MKLAEGQRITEWREAKKVFLFYVNIKYVFFYVVLVYATLSEECPLINESKNVIDKTKQ